MWFHSPSNMSYDNDRVYVDCLKFISNCVVSPHVTPHSPEINLCFLFSNAVGHL